VRRTWEVGMAGWPVMAPAGGVLNITAAAWTAGLQWWRSGNITRTQNVCEYMLVLVLCLVDFFANFSQNFFRMNTAGSDKFNHDFNHENRHSGTGYIEKALFVPHRFQSRFSAQWNTPLRYGSSIATSRFLAEDQRFA